MCVGYNVDIDIKQSKNEEKNNNKIDGMEEKTENKIYRFIYRQ